MPKRVRDYHEGLIESLRDPVEAEAYLNAHIDQDTDLFLLALRDVARARGMTLVARKSGLGRESLYKSLSESGNPRLETLQSVLGALGLRLAVTARS